MKYFTADTHFHHANIINLANRPAKDVGEMHDRLYSMLDVNPKPHDQLWVLGDYVMGNRATNVPAVTQNIKDLGWNSVHVIPGNHDRFHPMYKDSEAKTKFYQDSGVTTEKAFHTMNFGPHQVRLTHFPPEGDSQEEDRYKTWRPAENKSGLLLHGHVHGESQWSPHQWDIGVDNTNFKLVSEEDVHRVAEEIPHQETLKQR